MSYIFKNKQSSMLYLTDLKEGPQMMGQYKFILALWKYITQIIIIMSSYSIMMRELDKNENPQMVKEAVDKAIKTVQQRVYWLNTSQIDGDFLQQYWDKQVTANDVMKRRIAKITQQKFQQLFAEVNQGKLTPTHEPEVLHIGNLNLSSLAQDIPIFDPNYFSQSHPKTQQTKAKIKQIQQDYQQFKHKIQQLKKKQLQKKKEKEAMAEQARRSIQKQKKQKYKQQVLKTIQEKNHKKQERKSENQKYKQFLKAYKSSRPLHVLMQQEYKQKIQLPMLEENKKKLQQYKQKVKPTLQQINEHERSYLQSKTGRQSRIFLANRTIDVSFKSKFYLEEQQKFRDADEGYQTLFDQVQKKKRYSQLVKQNFKPKVSQKLRESINQSQMKSSSVVKQSLDRKQIIQRGKAYLQFMHSLQKNRKQHSSPSERVQQESPRYMNYLEGLKHSRQVQGNESKLSHDWQRDMKNKSLSEYEKRERILMKSKQLEQIAHRKEQFVNNYNYGKAEQIIQRKKQIDQTLISSIRAKVAVLKDAHQL